MGKSTLLWAAVLVCGCGGASTQPRDVLADTAWVMPIAGVSCDYGLNFKDDGSYIQAVLCTLGDGSQGAEVEKGIYSVTGKTLFITVRETSCASTTVNDSVDFSLANGNLNLMFPDGLAVLTPLPATSGGTGGSIPYGCYASDWTFYPMPIHPI